MTKLVFRQFGNTPFERNELKYIVKCGARIQLQYFRSDGGISSGPAPLLTFREDKTVSTSWHDTEKPVSDETDVIESSYEGNV